AQAEPHLVEAAPDGMAALEGELRARAEERAATDDATDDGVPLADAEARLAAAMDGAARARAAREALATETARTIEAIARREQILIELGREQVESAARLAALPSQEQLAPTAADARTRWIDARAILEALLEERAARGDEGAQLGFDQEKRAL